jgi:hypothetical protein
MLRWLRDEGADLRLAPDVRGGPPFVPSVSTPRTCSSDAPMTLDADAQYIPFVMASVWARRPE